MDMKNVPWYQEHKVLSHSQYIVHNLIHMLLFIVIFFIWAFNVVEHAAALASPKEVRLSTTIFNNFHF